MAQRSGERKVMEIILYIGIVVAIASALYLWWGFCNTWDKFDACMDKYLGESK